MIDNTLHFILAGVFLGLSAGFSPGPLLTLVLTQTIKHNRTEGIKVAISPLITDFPIILIAVLIFNRLSEFDLILAAISFAGGVYIAFLGIESIRIKEFSIDLQDSKTASIKKGIIANFLNPSPYLFWATVGVPLIFKAFQVNLLTSILFLISFYVLLIGSKVMIAFIVARTKVFMSQKIYVLVMRILGLVLLIFSLIFFYDGIKYL
ncbi:MAG: LysE family transporter [Lentimicrobium sp.]|jgi:threonine/homoserine/homoserine lactone efflux protein|nr:LysE family transporter [Lentimicrobium sp.]MDY0027312.1 LysE family transporter [Lentimicrobium sp.]HAH59752.1 LysE family translocator [Bacteroidales bacterium]